jgi:hypothetical protein
MLSQVLPATPYVAIAVGVVLAITIGIICYRQRSGRANLSASRPGIMIHDPDSSKPHDLDDPLFDREVQGRVGAAIANATIQKKHEP